MILIGNFTILIFYQYQQENHYFYFKLWDFNWCEISSKSFLITKKSLEPENGALNTRLVKGLNCIPKDITHSKVKNYYSLYW